MRDDGIHFPLNKDNYNDLCDPEELAPSILVVVLLPENEDQWLSQSRSELCLRHCGYYLPLQGQEATENRFTRTVVLPLSNVFNREGLNGLMDQARQGLL